MTEASKKASSSALSPARSNPILTKTEIELLELDPDYARATWNSRRIEFGSSNARIKLEQLDSVQNLVWISSFVFLGRVSSFILKMQVHHRMTKKIGLEKRLQNHSCEPLPSLNKPSNEGFLELEDGHVTPDSVLDSPVSPPASPDSTPSAEVVRRKRSRQVPMTRVTGRLWCLPATDVAGFINRRKGVPHRSPLH